MADLNFNCATCYSTSYGSQTIRVTVEEADEDDILSQLVDKMGLDKIISELNSDKVLEEIGVDDVKDYFDLVDSE